MPDNWEAPLGGVKAVEQLLAITAQRAGIPVPLLPMTKHQRRVALHGSSRPWGPRGAEMVAGVGAGGSPLA